ncbi:actin-related protein 8 [Tanacetum coccineum]
MNNNHASSSNIHDHDHDDDHMRMMVMMSYGSTGEFDKLPVDVFMQIVKLLEPEEVARLTSVCKTWKLLASDNKLWVYYLQTQKLVPWDAIFFSEISLRSGFPLQTFPSERQSFMSIYGQRAQVPGSIIIDGKDLFTELNSAALILIIFFSLALWMQVKSSTQPIVVSIPITQYDDTEAAKAARRQLKEAIYSALFGMNVPAVCAVSQATLALFAAKRTSGIVVNIGFHQTSVVPILHGKIMRKVGVETVGVGALKLTGYLREQMQQRNLHFDSLYTVRSLKENLCYVALDYEAELCKDTEASYEVAAAGWFTLKRERFQTGEVLFQPRIAGMRAMGLHQAVALCIDHCHDAELTTDESWYKTVVLAGGTACLPGVAERLEKELHDLLQPSIANGIKVIAPPYGADSAWYGAKLISNEALSTFPNSWCVTKKEFRSKARRNLIW